MMRRILKGSLLIKKRNNHLYSRKVTEKVVKDKVQEFYSLRCVPQILGPIYDTLQYAEKVILNEVNSVNDNPIVDVENENVFHGGNFLGDYISLEKDKLKIVTTKLTMLAERQLNFMLIPAINEKFPAFVNLGVLGLNLGCKGYKLPHFYIRRKCQTLSFPNYIHSFPNNNDNQDIVSNGDKFSLKYPKSN
jgi:histidine ammonia-lyase